MSSEHIRGVQPRWPAVTRTTVRRPGTLLPAFVTDVGAELPRLRSDRHLELVARLDGRADWPGRALHACLTQLLTSTVTEARRVWVVDAWTDHDDGICLVYRPPHDEGRVVGLRRRRRDAIEPSDWRIGDMTTWGYDMGPDTVDGIAVDAEHFGWNVADFDVGEPLGYVTTVLRYDTGNSADIGWWGNLDAALPVSPDDTR